MRFDDKWKARYEELKGEYQDLDKTTDEILIAYCKALTLYDDAIETVTSDGLLMENEKGKLIEHPIVGAMHKLSNEVKGLYTPLKRVLTKQQELDGSDEDEADDRFLFG